jgi:ferredoxin
MTFTRSNPYVPRPRTRGYVVPARFALEVDRIKCDGHGLCAEVLPELIELDDWSYPILRDATVPRDLESHARRAVVDCPVLALRLREIVSTG